MKKYLLLSLVLIASPAAAQLRSQFRKPWVDIRLGQHMALNKWNDAKYINDGMPRPMLTELRGTFNYSPHVRFPLGVFAEMGLVVMPAPAMHAPDLSRLPMPDAGNTYHLRETVSSSGSDVATAQVRLATGVMADLRLSDRVNLLPYLGTGGLTVPRRSHTLILKEEGSNNQYRAKYTWGTSASADSYYYSDGRHYYYNDDYSESEMLGYVVARLDMHYKLRSGSRLLLGIEYTHMTETTDFHTSFVNSFNTNVRKQTTTKGNRLNMLGISIGLAFR